MENKIKKGFDDRIVNYEYIHGKQKEDILSITRTVSIFSNDPVEFEKQIKIELDQIP